MRAATYQKTNKTTTTTMKPKNKTKTIGAVKMNNMNY